MEEYKQQHTPIFIAGSVRSGTKIMNHALQQGANIHGYKEGRFISLLGKFINDIETHYQQRKTHVFDLNIMLSRVNRQQLIEAQTDWFLGQYRQHNKFASTWIDKTTNTFFLYAIPYIAAAWPQAKFIYMQRRGLENIASRMRKFPKVSFQHHCTAWSKNIQLWQQVKAQLPETAYIEIDHYDVSTKPEIIAQKLADFFGLDDVQVRGIKYVFEKRRPECVGKAEQFVTSFNEIDWTDEQKELFTKTCQTVMEQGGWSLDDSYFIR